MLKRGFVSIEIDLASKPVGPTLQLAWPYALAIALVFLLNFIETINTTKSLNQLQRSLHVPM